MFQVLLFPAQISLPRMEYREVQQFLLSIQNNYHLATRL